MKKAFTLVEALVVISIIGIITATSIPVLSNYVPSIQLSGSSRVLSSNLRQAQEKAVTEQKQHLIRFNLAALPVSYQLIRINNGNEEIQSTTSLASGESLSLDSTISNNQIIFSPDGGPSSSGNITLTVGSDHKIINVSPAGFISIH